MRILGVGLLLIACSYLVLCCTVRKPVHIFGKEFVFPPPHIAFAQALVAGVDIIAAAACMRTGCGHENPRVSMVVDITRLSCS